MEGFQCFVCHKVYPTKRDTLVNKLLFPNPTCIDCAILSGRIYGERDPQIDKIEIRWKNFEEERATPPLLIDALSKHMELIGPNRTYHWTYLIGLYSSMDNKYTKYALYEVTETPFNWLRPQYVYLLNDIQKRVEEMCPYEEPKGAGVSL